MKLLWLCNLAPGPVREAISGRTDSGLWMEHVLTGLREVPSVTLHILCPDSAVHQGSLDERCSFETFLTKYPHEYLPELEEKFVEILQSYQPEVIHSWGVEYAHALAMVNAAERLGMLDRLVLSIQGLCSYITDHYADGIPEWIQNRSTFRDRVRKDNIAQQQKKFFLRGELEKKAIQKARHVIGRTHWDRACTAEINPKIQYHLCKETMRQEFYDGAWTFAGCQKHRIFASSCDYPVKGFHYLLEAVANLEKEYPDLTVWVPGKSYFVQNWKDCLRQSSYPKYLAELTRKYGLEDKIHFLGSLSAGEMKAQFLQANVFVLPSTMENSPNALGEAMLLGVPCVAAEVGGVATMLEAETEGLCYPSADTSRLAENIRRIFDMQEQAGAIGAAARAHAQRTHDPQNNLKSLLQIYEEIAK